MNEIKILRITAIGLFILALASFILWLNGLLDIKTMVIINWITFSTELLIFLIVMKTSIRPGNVIIPKGYCEEKAIKAELDIFPNFLVPTNIYRDCIFRISLQIKEFKKHPLFYIIRICEKDICIQELNNKIKLDPGLVHIFDVVINSKERLNFKFSEDVIIQKLLIEELYVT